MIFSFQNLTRQETFYGAKSVGGVNGDGGYSITVDNFGDVMYTGHFFQSADFLNLGSYFLNSSYMYTQTNFVAKLDASGNFVLANAMIGGNGCGLSVKVDSFNNVYSTGYFSGTVDFDPGIGNYYLTSLGNLDIFISKFNNLGEFVSTKKIGGVGDDIGHSLIVDNFNEILITGVFADSIGIENINLISNGSYDIFISKLTQCSQISSLTIPSNIVCPGTLITLSGTGGTNYNWSDGIANGIPFVVNSSNTYTVTGQTHAESV